MFSCRRTLPKQQRNGRIPLYLLHGVPIRWLRRGGGRETFDFQTNVVTISVSPGSQLSRAFCNPNSAFK